MDEESKESLDIVGFGKIARSIPKEVYVMASETALATFEKLTAPITETTSGLGRYLRQKFDNLVEVEKALATYTMQNAISKAQAKAATTGCVVHAPIHPKSFIKAIEESSKETDPLLHEMWTNLIASQISSKGCHPHFVEILPHFSPSEARLLASLVPLQEVGDNSGPYMGGGSFEGDFKHWVKTATDKDLKPWSWSCQLLYQLGLADFVGTKVWDPENRTTIMYRTETGQALLLAVSS